MTRDSTSTPEYDSASETTTTDAGLSARHGPPSLANDSIMIEWKGKLREYLAEEATTAAAGIAYACIAPCFEEHKTSIEVSSPAQAIHLLAILDDLLVATTPAWLSATQRRTINRIRGTLREELAERDIEWHTKRS